MDPTFLQDPGECQIQQSAFEGLFVKVLDVDQAFADDLRRVGFDIHRQQPHYASTVFTESLKVACRHIYPSQTTDDALRLIGGRFLDGFFDTIVGKVVAVMLPLLSPEGFLKRYPRFFSMAAPGVKMTVAQEADRNWRVELRDRAPVPYFNVGMIERVLERLGVKAEVRVREQSKWHFVLSITW